MRKAEEKAGDTSHVSMIAYGESEWVGAMKGNAQRVNTDGRKESNGLGLTEWRAGK